MAHQLSFEHLIHYNPAEAGVTVEVALKLYERSVSFANKVDTGSTYCIVEGKHGEALGLVIETGLLQPHQHSHRPVRDLRAPTHIMCRGLRIRFNDLLR